MYRQEDDTSVDKFQASKVTIPVVTLHPILSHTLNHNP